MSEHRWGGAVMEVDMMIGGYYREGYEEAHDGLSMERLMVICGFWVFADRTFIVCWHMFSYQRP